MLNKFDEFQDFTKAQVEAATAKSVSFAEGLQKVATETANFSKTYTETSTTAFTKLLGIKTPAEAIQIQADYAKTAYEAFVAHGIKVTEMMQGLTKQTFGPLAALAPSVAAE